MIGVNSLWRIRMSTNLDGGCPVDDLPFCSNRNTCTPSPEIRQIFAHAVSTTIISRLANIVDASPFEQALNSAADSQGDDGKRHIVPEEPGPVNSWLGPKSTCCHVAGVSSKRTSRPLPDPQSRWPGPGNPAS
jgi:hypothetical protein